MNLRQLAKELAFPGIDPRTFVLSGTIVDDTNSVRIESDGCMYADIAVAGYDVEVSNSENKPTLPEITVRLAFPCDGSGGIVYTGKPKPNTSVVVFLPNGTLDNDAYAITCPSSRKKLPKAVINDENSMHIIAPTGRTIRIGSRSAGSEYRAARVNDEIKVTSETDSAFISALQKLIAAFNTSISTGNPMIGLGDPISVPFTEVKGKITKGSSRVTIGGSST